MLAMKIPVADRLPHHVARARCPGWLRLGAVALTLFVASPLAQADEGAIWRGPFKDGNCSSSNRSLRAGNIFEVQRKGDRLIFIADGQTVLDVAVDMSGRFTGVFKSRWSSLKLVGRMKPDEIRANIVAQSCGGTMRLARVEGTGTQVAAAPTQAAPESAASSRPVRKSAAPVAVDDQPPVLALPAEASTERALVQINGSVSDGSQILELSVDGRPIPFGADGSFTIRRGVPRGASTLSVVAIDEWGNETTHRIAVTRNAGAAPAQPQTQPQTQVAAAPAPARPADSAPPTFAVPAKLETADATIELTGRVSDASRIVELQVAGRSVPLGDDGSFTVRRGVPQGTSAIELVATDEWGNRAETTVQVARLTAAQAFGLGNVGRYFALVIGNNAYQYISKLDTAVADAEAVAATLRSDYGFEVTLLLDATRYDITAAISKLRRQLTETDNLLIYYAGHGVVDDEADAGFWLPVDAEPDIESNWIANTFLSRNLKAMTAKHVMVVADSCYSGTLTRNVPTGVRSGRERKTWLQRMATKRTRTALVSGGLEPVMDGGGGGHSVFAKAFLDALADNPDVMDGQSLFARIQRPVVVNSQQTPEYNDIRRTGHDGGDFLFIRK